MKRYISGPTVVWRVILAIVLLLWGSTELGFGQTFDLQFVPVTNTATQFSVLVQIKSNSGTFGMGSANLVFEYAGGVRNPALLTAYNFSGGLYMAMTLTTPQSGRVSLNIEYLGASGNGTEVPDTYLDVATVLFGRIDTLDTVTLTWRTTPPNRTNVFADDNATEIPAETLNNHSGPLLSVEETIPHEFHVYQNYPNPFNPKTMIRFTVAEAQRVSVTVYDVLGQEVAKLFNGQAFPGRMYSLELDGTNLASGAYFYKVVTKTVSETRKIVLLK